MTDIWSDVFKDLIGKRVRTVHVNTERDVIVFELGAGPSWTTERVGYGASGDCCSESWFEHLSGSEALRDAKIANIEYATGEDQESARQDVDRLYFVTFITDKGRAVLEMRNASNGYYGGEIDPLPTAPENVKLVAEDF